MTWWPQKGFSPLAMLVRLANQKVRKLSRCLKTHTDVLRSMLLVIPKPYLLLNKLSKLRLQTLKSDFFRLLTSNVQHGTPNRPTLSGRQRPTSSDDLGALLSVIATPTVQYETDTEQTGPPPSCRLTLESMALAASVGKFLAFGCVVELQC